MRKVTTIHLNHNAYQIEEDGYEVLRAYLDRAARALASNPDRDEILSDLEQAIADKCRLTLGPHKTVVSAADIERILTEMGPVAGDADAQDGAAAATGQERANSGAAPGAAGFRPRRFYRIREGMMLSGVCQGLAAFAGIDATLVRIAVVLIALFTGFFPCVLVYVVMWFLVPMACSPEEVAAAHGQPFSAQEVVDRVKKNHADWRSVRRGRRHAKHGWWSARQAAPPPVAPLHAAPPPGPAARVTGGVLLPLLTVMSAVWFAIMAAGAYLMWQGWYPMGFNGWPQGSSMEHGNIPRWIALAAIVAIYALLALPIGAARRASLYYANGGHKNGWADAWSGMLWLAVVAVLLLAAWHFMPVLENELWEWRTPAPSISV